MWQKIFIAAAVLAVMVAFGIAGNDDYENEVATQRETAEIKQLMKQRQMDEQRDSEAYRYLFLNLGGSDEN